MLCNLEREEFHGLVFSYSFDYKIYKVMKKKKKEKTLLPYNIYISIQIFQSAKHLNVLLLSDNARFDF